jgi:hypothetical protein
MVTMHSLLPARRFARRAAVGYSIAITSACVLAASIPALSAQAKEDKAKRASLSLKVNPAISFSPARIVVTAELRGGAADDAELYCPQVEWDWGDGTRSEATENCDPFEAGKSEIKRRWSVSHTYTTAGNYRVVLRLKRSDKVVVSGNTTLQVKPGMRDQSEPFE